MGDEGLPGFKINLAIAEANVGLLKYADGVGGFELGEQMQRQSEIL